MKETGIVLSNFTIIKNEIVYFCNESKTRDSIKDVNLGLIVDVLTDSKTVEVSDYELYTDGIDYIFKISFKWNNKPFEIKGNMLSRNFEIIRGKV